MTTITPLLVIQACEQSATQWRRYIWRHGQRSALTCPIPRPAIDNLMASTGQDERACSVALDAAQDAGLILRLPQGGAWITVKGRALLANDPYYWGFWNGDGGYDEPAVPGPT